MKSESAENQSLAPEDLDREDEPLYLRRARGVPVRRGRVSRRVRRVALWGIPVAILLVAFAYGGYRVAHYALNSPLSELRSSRDVVISGNHYVSRAELLDALDLPPDGTRGNGPNLFRLSLDTLRDELESIPWIRSATLFRAFPSRLAVCISERVPVAYAEVDGHVKLVDQDGIVLEPPDKASFDFPVLQGLTDNQTRVERQERLQLYLRFTGDTHQEFSRIGWAVSEVDLSDPEDLQALIVHRQRTLLVQFGREKFAERLRNFAVLLPRLDFENTNIGSVDLRYRDEVVVNPSGPRMNQAGRTEGPSLKKD